MSTSNRRRGAAVATSLLVAATVAVVTRDGPAATPPAAGATPPATQSVAPPDLRTGPNVSLGGRQLVTDDDPWVRDVSRDPVDPRSDALIAGIGPDRPLHPDFGTANNGVPIGIPYVVVGKDQPRVPVAFDTKDESDHGPYPVPPDAPVEGDPKVPDGDRHVLILDKDRWMLYELFAAHPVDGGKSWRAGSGAIFDLMRPTPGQRPPTWTSADAAGLPVLPGLVRYDEVVEAKHLGHAFRFTVQKSRRAFVAPASHWASPHRDANLPPMGMRVRLKANYDVSKFPPNVQTILKALKKHGMILADNGGNWFMSGAPDPRWDDDELHQLKRVKGSDFEVVRMGPMTER
jgi:hypothetical protein